MATKTMQLPANDNSPNPTHTLKDCMSISNGNNNNAYHSHSPLPQIIAMTLPLITITANGTKIPTRTQQYSDPASSLTDDHKIDT